MMTNAINDPVLNDTVTSPAVAAGGAFEAYFLQRFARKPYTHAALAYEFTRDPGLLFQYSRLCSDMFSRLIGGTYVADQNHQVMVVRKGLQSLGGAALIVRGAKSRDMLPMEQGEKPLAALFPELDMEDSNCAEISSMAVLPEFHNATVFSELLRGIIRNAVSQEVEYLFAVTPLSLAHQCRELVHLLGVKWDICHHIEVAAQDSYEGATLAISVMDLSLQVRNFHSRRKTVQKADAQDCIPV
jgi:hypothetical protein